ncbi:DNA polymerase epsilon catalytic subunit a [Anaeramoeba flamelloides]|uniref:DNA polymerase epsilon catalytic subunit n=1 Tax=Anaeramoeba flamelloides TaxID=1746091 RepID=A0AAV7Y0W4_9EUKA|nr:DNA polymerase epsilon catalytic subunit a [Anaeramoeba flamelloides]
MEKKTLLQKKEQRERMSKLEKLFGFRTYSDYKKRLGWLFNVKPSTILEKDGNEYACLDLFFFEQEGTTFKVNYKFEPYILVSVLKDNFQVVENLILKDNEGLIASSEIVIKEDLDMKNHLSNLKKKYLKLNFTNIENLLSVRKKIMKQLRVNQTTRINRRGYELLEDIREYDIPYYQRVMIDSGIRCGCWYSVSVKNGHLDLVPETSKVQRPDLRILAYDIETTKRPLRFPDSNEDQIMMISYMVDGDGYLIVNRKIVSEDIQDFEYTPKKEFVGNFHIFNEKNEKATLLRFYQHIQEIKPNIIVTFNGDAFDFPFVDSRSRILGLSLYRSTGYYQSKNDDYLCKFALHLDAYKWVKRDSYLPMGSQGLKAVTRIKLGYDPLELDPEDMTLFATERPQELASYSVSDAVATYYLYMKYVHPFVFSLCTIVPMSPDDVLRKGTGTLCESLLMVKAFEEKIIFPNKKKEKKIQFHKNNLLQSETYIGGHVEALRSGIYRADLENQFELDPTAFEELIEQLDEMLKYELLFKKKLKMENVTNYQEIKDQVMKKLANLRDKPNRKEKPIIYHLDVAAMYPNIILTNRLQPPSIVDESICASCLYNSKENNCKRVLPWIWRGDLSMSNRSEFQQIYSQLEEEEFDQKVQLKNKTTFERQTKIKKVPFYNLKEDEKSVYLLKRLNSYTRRIYGKTHKIITENRNNTVCQRENPFYYNTVRSFRDRRYYYKNLLKEWSIKKEQLLEKEQIDPLEVDESEKMRIMYDSLQLAHKCILNSFYGYVMRKGSRWFSMEMAGIVTLNGANIITQSRETIERIGIPLELDTDGIWCVLPSVFPEDLVFQVKTGNGNKIKKVKISYPCLILNYNVFKNFSNPQFQMFNNNKNDYDIQTENTIEFEVDGPYYAMILPASTKENESIKKRYAVFNFDRKIAELKGFEIKRRGELKMVKILQSHLFDAFLKGSNIQECYREVAKVSLHYLDILYSKGVQMPDWELIEYIGETRNMSKPLFEYGDQKSTVITTARRLSEFSGKEYKTKGGIACSFIISNKPLGASVTERAIPLKIFQTQENVKKRFIKKWSKNSQMQDFTLRSIIDWDYYLKRIGTMLQKIVTIPAALQGIENPLPCVKHPDWLIKKIKIMKEKGKQKKITNYFQVKKGSNNLIDIEDIIINKNHDQKNNKNLKNKQPKITQMFVSKASKRKAKNQKKKTELKKQKYQELKIEELIDKLPEINDKLPSEKRRFNKWLNWQKTKWKLLVKSNKRFTMLDNKEDMKYKMNVSEEELFDLNRNRLNKNNEDHEDNYLINIKSQLLKFNWHILSIQKNYKKPDLFTIWLIINNSITSINLRVKRKFYINSKTKLNYGKKLEYNCHLPRKQPPSNLYSIELSEKQYQKTLNDLKKKFVQPNITGVFERQIPLDLQIILSLGNVCKLTKDYLKNNKDTNLLNNYDDDETEKEYELYDLETIDTQAKNQKTFNKYKELVLKQNEIFIYQNFIDKFGTFSIYIPKKRTSYIIIFCLGTQPELPSFQKIWKEIQDNGHINTNANINDSNISFKKTFEKTLAKAKSKFNKILSQVLESSGNLHKIITISSKLESKQLYKDHPILLNHPIIRSPYNNNDSNCFKNINWQKQMAEILLNRLSQFSNWYINSIELAQYSGIPLGNFETDKLNFVSDVMFSRRLRLQNHLLWISNNANKPDLGGIEEDENLFFNNLDEKNSLSKSIINPGIYTNVCIELEMHYLPIVSIVSNEFNLNDYSNTNYSNEKTFVNNNNKTFNNIIQSNFYAEKNSCSKAMETLRVLAIQWMKDCHKKQYKFVDSILINFLKWINDTNSKLFDPILQSFIMELINNSFKSLVNELEEKYSAKIIFANLNKIILVTPRSKVSDSLTYMSTVLQGIRKSNNISFRYLDLQPVNLWSTLIFLDEWNFSGLLVPQTTDNFQVQENGNGKQNGEEEEEEELMFEQNWSNDVNEFKVISTWNIAEFLPNDLHRKYYHFTELFLNELLKFKKQSENDMMIENMNDGLSKKTKINKDGYHQGFDGTDPETVSFIQHILKNVFANQLFQTISQFSRSNKINNDDIINFIIYVCQVFSFNKKIKPIIENIKKNLLKLVKISSFSQKVQYQNPCTSIVLNNYTCNFCNSSKDLDISRDINILSGNWMCTSCSQPYNLIKIESKLIQKVNKQLLSYQLQDLKCEKCGLLRRGLLEHSCQDSGKYINKINKDNFIKELNVLLKISQKHNFERLEELISSILPSEN